MKHKHSHIEVVNKRSTYNNIQLKSKSVADISSQQMVVKADSGSSSLRH